MWLDHIHDQLGWSSQQVFAQKRTLGGLKLLRSILPPRGNGTQRPVREKEPESPARPEEPMATRLHSPPGKEWFGTLPVG